MMKSEVGAAQAGALTQKEWAGLAKIGDWAFQIEDLLTLVRDVLSELPEAVDEDKVIAAFRPKLQALKETSQEALDLLHIDSAESANERVRDMLHALKRAQLDVVLPQLLDTLALLHDSGMLNRVQIVLRATSTLPQGESLQALIDKVYQLQAQLPYWMDTVKQALAALSEAVLAMNLPEKVDELQEAADAWLRIAMRVKALAQGDADNLAVRVSGLLDQAEYWGGQLSIGIGTLKDVAPEAFKDLDVAAVMAQVKAAAQEWLDIAQQAQALVVGDAPSLAERVRRMLAGVRQAHLDEMLPDLINVAGAVHRSGLLKRASTAIDALQPYLPSDAQLKAWIDEGMVLAKRYQPQVGIALAALEQTQEELRGQEKKGGGIMGLLRILFSKDTQYVLRFMIRFFYNDLKAQKK
ncbi:MAG: hypothetical protein ACOY5C_08755 [Pseudomonadota bacterium]|uniref:hypothetical protein n=1 Tax=Thermithiobacillus tepidarius TaxID=929 RepID=UPI0012DF64AA|nr:hypothetical protein [Thermithiobacillus tepidarius]